MSPNFPIFYLLVRVGFSIVAFVHLSLQLLPSANTARSFIDTFVPLHGRFSELAAELRRFHDFEQSHATYLLGGKCLQANIRDHCLALHDGQPRYDNQRLWNDSRHSRRSWLQ